jgi:hypothetical protein
MIMKKTKIKKLNNKKEEKNEKLSLKCFIYPLQGYLTPQATVQPADAPPPALGLAILIKSHLSEHSSYIVQLSFPPPDFPFDVFDGFF